CQDRAAQDLSRREPAFAPAVAGDPERVRWTDMRIIDLSVALKAGIASDPPYMLPQIEYLDHAAGAVQFEQTFPGLKREQLPDGYVCKPDDVERELDRIGYKLRALDIVLVNTAAGAAYGRPDFIDKGCGMGREATLHLTRQGVRVTGTDGWSWDAPFSFTRKR